MPNPRPIYWQTFYASLMGVWFGAGVFVRALRDTLPNSMGVFPLWVPASVSGLMVTAGALGMLASTAWRSHDRRVRRMLGLACTPIAAAYWVSWVVYGTDGYLGVLVFGTAFGWFWSDPVQQFVIGGKSV